MTREERSARAACGASQVFLLPSAPLSFIAFLRTCGNPLAFPPLAAGRQRQRLFHGLFEDAPAPSSAPRKQPLSHLGKAQLLPQAGRQAG